MRKFLLALIVIILILVFYFNREDSPKRVERTGLAMNTIIKISIYDYKNYESAKQVLDDAFEFIKNFEAQISLYDENSQINKINKNAGIAPVAVSDDVINLISRSVEINKLTDNIFNPLIGPVTKLWNINKKDEKSFKMPDKASLDEAIKLTDINFVKIDFDKKTVYLDKKGAMLDLSGIAKGYASKKIADMFIKLGIKRASIDLGGNIQVIGDNFNIGIRDPRYEKGKNKSGVITAVKAANTAVITSGAYERYKIIDGVKYSHFFNPVDGMPVENAMLSATVITPDGALADALATAFMIMGRDKALEFLDKSPSGGEDENLKDIKAVLVVNENENIKIIERGISN